MSASERHRAPESEFGGFDDEPYNANPLMPKWAKDQHALANVTWCHASKMQAGDDLEFEGDYYDRFFCPVHLGDRLGPDGQYRVVHKLGHGGHGTVWLCRDELDPEDRISAAAWLEHPLLDNRHAVEQAFLAANEPLGATERAVEGLHEMIDDFEAVYAIRAQVGQYKPDTRSIISVWVRVVEWWNASRFCKVSWAMFNLWMHVFRR